MNVGRETAGAAVCARRGRETGAGGLGHRSARPHSSPPDPWSYILIPLGVRGASSVLTTGVILSARG